MSQQSRPRRRQSRGRVIIEPMRVRKTVSPSLGSPRAAPTTCGTQRRGLDPCFGAFTVAAQSRLDHLALPNGVGVVGVGVVGAPSQRGRSGPAQVATIWRLNPGVVALAAVEVVCGGSRPGSGRVHSQLHLVNQKLAPDGSTPFKRGSLQSGLSIVSRCGVTVV